ncbi:MAG TPA: cation transporter [Deltaproteobacteria bacterium]|jgi:cobalt-zinc-cadmium efflux system protein|nr:cation transporter [Deltaproteobacteria bacterium]
MSAEADHGHAGQQRGQDRRALRRALAIAAGLLAIEVVGGIASGSLALLADAGHVATDMASLALALFALHLADREPTASKTFGYRRTEILAALANGTALGVVAVFIALEAVGRLASPPEVKSGLMLAVAAAGFAANLFAGAMLFRRREHSLNLRAAFLHVLSDALGSLGAITAGLAIQLFGWRLADPIVAIAISALILVSSWRLVRESVDVLMEATPSHVELGELERAIRGVAGVLGVHDLHVWTLTSGYHAMSAHVDVRMDADPHAVLHMLSDLAKRRFEIEHTTFQLEEQPPLLHIEPAAPVN